MGIVVVHDREELVVLVANTLLRSFGQKRIRTGFFFGLLGLCPGIFWFGLCLFLCPVPLLFAVLVFFALFFGFLFIQSFRDQVADIHVLDLFAPDIVPFLFRAGPAQVFSLPSVFLLLIQVKPLFEELVDIIHSI